MLYALFSEQRDTYARQVNKVGRIQLVVGAMDGWAIAVQDTQSQVGFKCLNDKRFDRPPQQRLRRGSSFPGRRAVPASWR